MTYRDDEPPSWEDTLCDVCGQMPDRCVCPSCPECGAQGDEDCYIGSPERMTRAHPLGRNRFLRRTRAQLAGAWAATINYIVEQQRDEEMAKEVTDEHSR